MLDSPAMNRKKGLLIVPHLLCRILRLANPREALMKAFVAIMLIAGAVQATPALARPPAVSPLVGSWAVDVSRLPMAPAARPKSVTITFRDADEGKWTTQVDIVGADGKTLHSADTATLDGTAIKSGTASRRIPPP
jgi:hypothetical protein